MSYFNKDLIFQCLEINSVTLPVLKESMGIALFYCPVHFSAQKSETLFESEKYLAYFFFSF